MVIVFTTIATALVLFQLFVDIFIEEKCFNDFGDVLSYLVSCIIFIITFVSISMFLYRCIT